MEEGLPNYTQGLELFLYKSYLQDAIIPYERTTLAKPAIYKLRQFLYKDKKESGADKPIPEIRPMQNKIDPERNKQKVAPIKYLYKEIQNGMNKMMQIANTINIAASG